MKALAALLAGITAWAAVDDDPIEVLTRVRDRVLEHGQRIPNHTCVETAVRDRYDYARGPAPRSCDDLLGRRKLAGAGTLIRLAATDRLRLDVGMTNAREIYSWPGASRFDERDLDELAPQGAIGSGPFASMLVGMFEVRNPVFAFEGETTLNGRRLLKYSFVVSGEQSHYKARAGSQWVITGYTGTMLVDPATAELVQLNVRTEELPAATHACEVDTSVEYGTVRLGGEDHPMPTLARQRFIEPDGAEHENSITFAQCREFRGESALSFGPRPAVEGKPQATPTRPAELPHGLPLTVELTSTIQADQAAAGDRIEGRLAAPIREASGRMVNEGAAVEGRLTLVDTRYGRPDRVTIGLLWESVELNGVRVPLAPDRNAGTWGTPQPFESASAVYRFSGEHVVVKGGLRSQWFTAEP
jgi:hypothetical protein